MQTSLADTRPLSGRCPRCQGPMFRDYDSARWALLCLLCGEYTFPSTPRRLQVGKRLRAIAGVATRGQAV
jgi:hypothetical protein